MLRFGAQSLGKHRRLADRQLGIDHNVGFSVQPVAYPSCPRAVDRGDAGHVQGGVAELGNDMRVDAVQESREHGLGRLPDDAEDHGGDDEAYDRVGERKAEPDAERAHHHGEAREPVDPRVVAVWPAHLVLGTGGLRVQLRDRAS
jgi:hypothetical protein